MNWKFTSLLAVPLALSAFLLLSNNKRNRSLVPLQSGILPKNYKAGNSATALAFSPDSQTLAIGDMHNQLHLWDVSARKFEKRYGISYSFESLQWKADSLTATSASSCRIFQSQTGKIKLEFPTSAQSKLSRFKFEPYNQVVALPDASTIALAQIDGKVSVWNARTGALRTHFHSPNRETCGLALSGDAKILAVGHLILDGGKINNPRTISIGTEITLRDTQSGKLLRTLPWNEARIGRRISYDGNLNSMGLNFSADGNKLVAVSPHGIRVWDVNTGKTVFTSVPDKKWRMSGDKPVIFSPNGALVAGSWGPNIGVWSVKTKKLSQMFLSKIDISIRSLAFSPDSKLLASGGQNGDGNGIFQIWDVSDLK